MTIGHDDQGRPPPCRCPRPARLGAARTRVAECLACGRGNAAALRALAGLAEARAGSGRDRRPVALSVGAGAARPGAAAAHPPEKSRRRARRALAPPFGLPCAPIARRRSAMSLLRKAKQEIALIVALADLAGDFDVVAATRALSRAADRFVATALARRLAAFRRQAGARRSARARARLRPRHSGAGQAWRDGAELFLRRRSRRVLRPALARPRARGRALSANSLRLTQHLVKLLQERTGDGYVLRVDLRLRPDPGSTAAGRLARRRAALLRDARPELGARRHDQGAPGGRRSRAGLRFPR